MAAKCVAENGKLSKFASVGFKSKHFCAVCTTKMILYDGFYVCTHCGAQVRTVSHSVLAFNHMRDYSSIYTREYRFRILLRDLNGSADLPDVCVEMILKKLASIKTCIQAKALLKSDKIFRKHQNQVATVMNICGTLPPQLQPEESRRCILLFTMLDIKIGQLFSIKVAFTYILPQILRLVGRTEWEDGGYLKKISALLEKKYGNCTREAIKHLNLTPKVVENTTVIQ